MEDSIKLMLLGMILGLCIGTCNKVDKVREDIKSMTTICVPVEKGLNE